MNPPTTAVQTATPETDQAMFVAFFGNSTRPAVSADFARKLEIQRDSALAQLRQAREDCERLDWLVENRARVTKHADGMFDVWLPSKSYETARGLTARAAIDAARSALSGKGEA